MPTRNAGAGSADAQTPKLFPRSATAPRELIITGLPPLERLLRIASVVDLTSLSKASIYRKVADRTFPPPLKIGKSRVAWRQSAISSWIAEQSASANPSPPACQAP